MDGGVPVLQRMLHARTRAPHSVLSHFCAGRRVVEWPLLSLRSVRPVTPIQDATRDDTVGLTGGFCTVQPSPR